MSAPQEPVLKVTTLALVCQLLLVASRRGAFGVEEFTKVGAAYDEVASYAQFHMPELFVVNEAAPTKPEENLTEEPNGQLLLDFTEKSEDEGLNIGVELDADGKIVGFELQEEGDTGEPDNVIQGAFGAKAEGESPDAA